MKREDKAIVTTRGSDYTQRLMDVQNIWYKRFIDVQLPYRWNLQRLKHGLTLDIGCGIGRNLLNLRGQGVGIDHNADSVQIARQRGLTAFTPEQFQVSSFNEPERFDSLLLSHVAEHMTLAEAVEVLRQHLHLLKHGGKVIIFTPQEAGQRSDPTHVEFMDLKKLREITVQLRLSILKEYSFPFPRIFGHLFLYNEFVSVSCKK
jgi:2-polyprenyl-3-methyl-5-hydroxy-6-metoxy-1,4-benzoquinol methylase